MIDHINERKKNQKLELVNNSLEGEMEESEGSHPFEVVDETLSLLDPFLADFVVQIKAVKNVDDARGLMPKMTEVIQVLTESIQCSKTILQIGFEPYLMRLEAELEMVMKDILAAETCIQKGDHAAQNEAALLSLVQSDLLDVTEAWKDVGLKVLKNFRDQ